MTPIDASTLKRLRTDLPLYSKTVLKIRAKNSELVPLSFNDAQLKVHGRLAKQRRETGRVRAIVLKARQEGVSTYTAARFFRAMHLRQGVKSMVIADSLERAGVLFDIYQRYLQNVPEELAPTGKAVSQRKRMAFAHDSELAVRPASDTEAGRAQTIHLVHASEIAFWGSLGVDASATWTSLMQAVPHNGSEVIVESTAKGAGGLFHEMWENAENGDSGWLPIFLPWWIHGEYQFECSEEMREIIDGPERDEFEEQALTEGIWFEGKPHILDYDQLAWRRRVIVENFGGDAERLGRDATRNFQQEYPATAEEAFLVSGACFFDEDALRLMTRTAGEATQRGRLIEDNGMVRLVPSARGSVRIYDSPGHDKHYVIGADTAEGKLVATRPGTSDERGGRDYSAAVVLDVHENKVVAELHGRVPPEVFAEQLRLLGNYYACGGGKSKDNRQVALIGVERSHSSGQTVLRLLREHYHYPRLFWAREFNKLTRRTGRVLGWNTTVETRMPMLDEVGMLLRQGKMSIPSKDLVREMVTFVVWEDGKPAAEEGCHDDRVIALAIAKQMAREHRHTREEVVNLFTPADTPTGF